ncbi:hypothetical protein [Salinicoccus halodurans]|uniref:Uncharacterized protein n=1 Tax=Salinicoccus halodurans TaxID=407035 RepID=A0A0F7D4Y7_9STAP|nr:hypothetical protein [Salinicoccus halodurans]AKG75055.1 hypothetical protein AAT16_13190 [Salinicoccus halodurans]SFK65189.1 hypothetical protein SAMN05216235_0894 [Salinicoccus halodurans]
MADEKRDRMTTEEEEKKLERRKDEAGPHGEVKEDVPPDSPATERDKEEAQRERDVRNQRSDKTQLGDEADSYDEDDK